MDEIEALPERWIEISALPYKDHVRISLRNSGHGTSKDIEKKMLGTYEMTYQEDPHTMIILNLPTPQDRHA
jgi:hypothetical protein